MPQRIILDVDTGTDDAVALMVAALCPELELVGVTTVNGNCPVEVCTENTLRVFDHIGVRVPVFEGVAAPLARPGFEHPRHIHGTYLDIAPATTPVESAHAVDWLIATLLASEGDIVLVPVAPLTNIALAIRREPRILDQIKELVIMGGGHATGNVTPAAEFNIWADPEAARVVLGCGRPIRMVALDATHRALISLEDCAALRAAGTPAAEATAVFTEHRIRTYDDSQPMQRPHAAPVHDALAVCAIIDPSVIETVPCHVDVELHGELTTGKTVCDRRRMGAAGANAEVALDADERKFANMLMRILGGDPVGPECHVDESS